MRKLWKEVEEQQAKIRVATEEALRTDANYAAFFSTYQQESVETFIPAYAKKKAELMTDGKECSMYDAYRLLYDEENAHGHLWEIQQRKLFELQCRWRAGLIDLPEVRQTYDFEYWGALIERCPFLPPITQDEYERYMQYLHSDAYEQHLVWHNPWQRYDVLVVNSEEGVEILYPAWYEYCDSLMGAAWKQLPDIRGEEERPFRYAARRARADTGTPAQNNKDDRPWISANDPKTIETFIRAFESAELIRYYQAVQRAQQRKEADEDIDHVIRHLQKFDEPLPIAEAGDWRKAIFDLAAAMERKVLVRGCERAYDEYVRRQAMNLPQELSLDDDAQQHEEHDRELMWQELQDGKRILGVANEA